MGSIKGAKRGPYKTHAGKAVVQLKPEDVAATLRKERGSIFHTAMAHGVTRSRMIKFIEQSKPCAEAYKEAHEVLGDIAERKLWELVEAGELRALIWYLGTMHAHRGYGKFNEQSELPFGEVRKPMHVSQVNIIAIPNGQFLTREQARAMTIEAVAVEGVPLNGHSHSDRRDNAGAVVADESPSAGSIFD